MNSVENKHLDVISHASYFTKNEDDCIVKCLFQPDGCFSLNYYNLVLLPSKNCMLMSDGGYMN